MDSKKPEDTCVLVTGGAGFIGSHTVVDLLENGYHVVIVDDLSNSSPRVLDRIHRIVGDEAFSRCTFHEVDICDRAALEEVFARHDVDRVIHFAGFKAVGESVEKPLEYYSNNIGGTLTLCEVMREAGCKAIIFSSSATVYGDPDALPLTEDSPKKPATNPYGWTKWMIEQVLTDLTVADPEWDVVLLRYFNPIGAHPSGLIGEDPKGIPNNLVPYVAQTAVGKREAVHVFGDDYPTPDGSCIRDYIDVTDLAKAHVAAIGRMVNGKSKSEYEVFNIGTGRGVSVLELVKGFERVNGVKLNYRIAPRRAGDIIAIWADPTLANTELGWKAERPLDETLASAWKWQQSLK